MDCADTDAHAMWAEFQKRFKNLGDSGLLPDLKSVWKGTIQVADWMHGFGMAHGDIKPSNVLLKRLETTPDSQHVAFCVASIRLCLAIWATRDGPGRQSMQCTCSLTRQEGAEGIVSAWTSQEENA